MNQSAIGHFIALKRKEKNLTQAQLAERLGISNKTVSKWENGKCMPDYGIIQDLCRELDVTLQELMDGGEATPNSIRAYDEEQILDLLRRTKNLENQRTSLYGIVLLLMGVAMLVLHYNVGGSDLRDFISGVLLGISVGVMLVGICVMILGFSKRG